MIWFLVVNCLLLSGVFLVIAFLAYNVHKERGMWITRRQADERVEQVVHQMRCKQIGVKRAIQMVDEDVSS